MMKIKLNSALVLVATFLVIFLIGNSCNKNKECKAAIAVYDSTGSKPQVGVVVKLYATVTTSSGSTQTADLKAEGTTDASGKVFFTFKLPAIMDVQAQKPNCVPAIGVWCSGKGIIKLEEGKTTDKIILLKQ